MLRSGAGIRQSSPAANGEAANAHSLFLISPSIARSTAADSVFAACRRVAVTRNKDRNDHNYLHCNGERRRRPCRAVESIDAAQVGNQIVRFRDPNKSGERSGGAVSNASTPGCLSAPYWQCLSENPRSGRSQLASLK
jgi:hypothetical protein